MSDLVSTVTTALDDVSSFVGQVLMRQPRRIGTILPHVVVEEISSDDLVITEHPVERGSFVTDHTYRRPSELRMKAAWSASAPFAFPTLADDYAKRVYEELRALQQSRVPFELTTGKRQYKDMLMQSLIVTTDRTSEYTLRAEMTFREVNLVTAKVESVPPAGQHATPRETSPMTETGVRQPIDLRLGGTASGITAGPLGGAQRALSVIRKLDEIRSARGLPSTLLN